MNALLRLFGSTIFLVCLTTTAYGDVVIEDAGIAMSREELAYIVSTWPGQVQRAAANDLGDRIELLNQAMALKKIAEEVRAMTPEQDGDEYWLLEIATRKMYQRYMVDRFLKTIEVPDMSALAQERYETEKDKYAAVPPRRLSSHILLLCPAGSAECDRNEKRAQADKILAELQTGADFEALVLAHSQDPGSRQKKGFFDKWLEPDEPTVDRAYRKAVFAIENEGDYSGVVISAYGFHIIRLDEAQEAYYKPYSEVRAQIIADLVTEYKNLSVKIYDEGFRFTDDLYIDGETMEEIFSQYKTGD